MITVTMRIPSIRDAYLLMRVSKISVQTSYTHMFLNGYANAIIQVNDLKDISVISNEGKVLSKLNINDYLKFKETNPSMKDICDFRKKYPLIMEFIPYSCITTLDGKTYFAFSDIDRSFTFEEI